MTRLHNIHRFDGISPATVCSIDLNPFDEGGIFGSGDAEKAKKVQKNATTMWTGGAQDPLHPKTVFDDQGRPVQENTGMFGEIPTVDQSTLSFGSGEGDINPYSVGPMYQAAQMGPWDSGTSAYEGRGPSAYADLSMDPEARAGMKSTMGYFQGLETNPNDAIAEADYQRAAKKAELSRRASTEAALQNAEARGMAGSGDALLAQLTGAQGSAADTYQAGLDRAATAAARRDAAAQAAGGMAATLGGQQAAIDTARAGGVDAYGNATAAGEDAFKGMNAQHIFDTNQYNTNAQSQQNLANTQRAQSVGDTNTATHNQNVLHNQQRQDALTQQNFGNKMAVMGGATGQMANQADTLGKNAVYPLQDAILPTVSNVAKAAVK